MSLAKKLKMIVKGEPKPTFGTDPNEPWSARAGITEAEAGMLSSYLKSRGINPEFVSKDTKISHAKSGEFSKWKRDHMFDDPADTVSSVAREKMKAQREEVELDETMTLKHTPTEIRQHMLNRQKHMTKVLTHNGLHKEELEQIDELAPETLASYVLKTTSKDPNRAEPRKKAMSKLAKIMAKRSFSEAKTIQGTALDKFRQAAAERARKHDDIERAMKARHAAGKEDMKGSIDRLQAQLNKEESINEVSGSEVEHHFNNWTNSEHAPYNSDAGDDNKVHQSALNYLRTTNVPKEQHHKLATHIANKFHGSGIDEAAGVSKETETKFHKKLDKLVHSTFGKRKDEMKMKEEVEQIDEISKSTLASYKDKSSASMKNAQANRDAAEPGKNMSKGFADLHTKSDSIVKKRVKGLIGYMQRKQGMKPTSEDVYQDPQAATQTAFDMGTQADDREPTYSKKKEMSKSARMIKSLYKHHNMKEEIYDHEKEDKSVATYGKKPKVEKVGVDGNDDNQAGMVLKGGKTLTGQERDTLEIDPVMRKPSSPDNKNSNKKTDK